MERSPEMESNSDDEHSGVKIQQRVENTLQKRGADSRIPEEKKADDSIPEERRADDRIPEEKRADNRSPEGKDAVERNLEAKKLKVKRSSDINTMESFVIGDHCFAHVKGFPWWPAVVVNVEVRKRKKGVKEVFSVVFHGTNETADLPSEELRSLTPENKEKCATKAALKRKHYKEGYEKMLKDVEVSFVINEPEHIQEHLHEESETFDLETVDQVKFLSFLGLVENSDQRSESKQAGSESPKTNAITEFMDEFEESGEVCHMILGKFVCSECRLKFKCEESLEMHNYLKHSKVDTDEDDDDISFGIDPSKVKERQTKKDSEVKTKLVKDAQKILTSKLAVQKVGKKGQAKCKKQKSTSKLVKSLRDQELEGNKIFQETIEVKDSFYYCKKCSKFSTTTLLLAKAHVVSCGKIRKQGRPTKHSDCPECSKRFSSVKEMHKHHLSEHASQNYCCSTCLKTFTRRQAYSRHLLSHRELPRLKCPHCEKIFRYQYNLKRHIRTHSDKVKAVQMPDENEADTVSFETNLEEKRIGKEYTGKLSVTELPSSSSKYQRNHTSFQSTLGFKNIEDWQVFLGLSNALCLPLSDDPEAFQTCVYSDSHGKETVEIAWSSVPSSSAPELPSLDDLSAATNEEVLEAVDSIIEAEKNWHESNRFFEDLLKVPEDNAVDGFGGDLVLREQPGGNGIIGSAEGKCFFVIVFDNLECSEGHLRL